MKLEVVNMEFGYPTVPEARARLTTELELARRKGVRLLKIIHGYGSSGRGGKLRPGLRRMLHELQRDGKVGRVVAGEAWTIFDQTSRELLDLYSELRGDRDLDQSNPGITLVEVKKVSEPRASPQSP